VKKVLAACGAVVLVLAVGVSLLIVLTQVWLRREVRETEEALEKLEEFQFSEPDTSPQPSPPATSGDKGGTRGLP
jgi:hypothetical protein